MKKYNTILSLILIVLLASFSAVNAFHKPRELSERENRTLAAMPQVSVSSIFDGTFMKEFETYTTDQFILRDKAIELRANMEYLLGKSENNGVYFASDRYLIAHPERYNEENVDKNIDSLSALADTGLYNITAAIVPTAFEALKDKLPPNAYDDRILKVNNRINERLADSGIALCDTYPMLNEHKDDYIYYRTDHHMTSEGSYYLYELLGSFLGYEPYPMEDFAREVLSNEFRGSSWSKAAITFAKKDTIERFVLPGSTDQTIDYPIEGKHSDNIYNEKYADMEDKYSVFIGGNHDLSVIHSNCGSEKKLAVIKDSYSHSLAPFLANHYESVHLVDLRYYNEDLLKYLEDNEITDILILYNSETFNNDTSITKLGEYTVTSSIFDPPPYGFLDVTDPVGDEYFSDAVFFGDSIVAGFSYNAAFPAKFVCKASVNTESIYTTMLGSRSVADALFEQDALKYYIQIGINEVSFRPAEEYKENLRKLVRTIREKNPASLIYLQSVMPVAHSTEERTAISKAKIDAYNEVLVALAQEESCYYLNVNGALAESDGYLAEGVASDGIHFGAPYHARWEAYIKNHAVQDKRKNKQITIINPYAGGESINFASFAQEMVDCVPFEDTLAQVSGTAAARMFNLTEGEVLGGVVYTGSGATADEFAAFEAPSPEKAQEIAQKLRERIEARKRDFENYIPQEMPKLNSPVVIVDGNLAAMCITSDPGAAQVVISHY